MNKMRPLIYLTILAFGLMGSLIGLNVLGQNFAFIPLFLSLFLGYLWGSIPFGLLLTKYSGLGDIRKIGSGNIGATNVLRTGRKKLAILTLLMDALKAMLALYTAQYLLKLPLSSPYIYGAGAAAVLGHMFPVWLNFKGGKGVATLFGTLLVLSPLTAFLTLVTWIGSALLTRFSSLAALIAAVLGPLYGYWVEGPSFMIWFFILSGFVILKHWKNIQRLLRHEEPKIGQS